MNAHILSYNWPSSHAYKLYFEFLYFKFHFEVWLRQATADKMYLNGHMLSSTLPSYRAYNLCSECPFKFHIAGWPRPATAYRLYLESPESSMD